MPITHRPPSYRYHKARNCAVVTLAGKNFYLGPYGSSEIREKYARLIAQWEANGRKHPPQSTSGSLEQLRVKDVILRYFQFAQVEYVDENGQPTGEVTSIRVALRRLRMLFANLPVLEFGPKALKVVQQSMAKERLSRRYTNDTVHRIRRMFRWAVSEEILPSSARPLHDRELPTSHPPRL